MINLTSKRILTVKYTCIAMCVSFGMSFNVDAAGKTNFIAAGSVDRPVAGEEAAGDGMRQTLNLNFSPENREKIRKALDDYAKSVDQDHDRIEERRRAMQESLKERFLDADNDNDGTIDRQEATEKLPQIARLFSQVDTNQDGVISLEELQDAQSRAAERRSAAEAAIEAQKLQAIDASAATKSKSKQASNNSKKRTY
ncbi:MAG: EF-hand domain-containing protein [Pseudomonadota bacterium]